jgi:hypothetical protein
MRTLQTFLIRTNWLVIAITLAAWTIFGVAFATQRYFARLYVQNPTSLLKVLTAWLACAYLWAVLTAPVVWLSRRLPLTTNLWPRNALYHLTLGLIISAVHLVLYLQVLDLLTPANRGTFASIEMLKDTLVANLHFNLLVYVAIVAVAQYAERHKLMVQQNEGNRALQEEVHALRQKPAYLRKITVKVRDGKTVIPVDDIRSIHSDDNYVHINCCDNTYMHRESLSRLVSRLDPARFVRVRRSAVVNIDRVKNLLPVFDREFILVLDDGSRVQSSRRYRKNLDSLLK